MHAVRLTGREERLFALVMDCVETHAPNTTPRVAGGWVRNKLMGRDGGDIDIALDTMGGERFVHMLHKHARAKHARVSHAAVVRANPEQSKHLETATMNVLGEDVDFAHLRSESYADEASRIPTDVAHASAEEDARRRDFTLNALFWNMRTREVEDYTGRGVADLERGVLRTPDDAAATFRDDPLRVLRGLRFVSQYGFELDAGAVAAAGEPWVCDALRLKVSPERVGKELALLLRGEHWPRALALMGRLGVHVVPFAPPARAMRASRSRRRASSPTIEWTPDAWTRAQTYLTRAASLLPAHTGNSSSEVQACVLTACVLLPVMPHDAELCVAGVTDVVMGALRWSRRECAAVHTLLTAVHHAPMRALVRDTAATPAAAIARAAGGCDELGVAHWVRECGALWREGLLMCGVFDDVPPEHIAAWRAHVERSGLASVVDMRPLVKGGDVARALGVQGRAIGAAMQRALDYQMVHRDADAAAVMAHLLTTHDPPE